MAVHITHVVINAKNVVQAFNKNHGVLVEKMTNLNVSHVNAMVILTSAYTTQKSTQKNLVLIFMGITRAVGFAKIVNITQRV